MVTIKAIIDGASDLVIPSHIGELDFGLLKRPVDDVKIEKNYAIIAVVCRTPLATFVDNNKNKDKTVSATYVLITKNDPNNAISAEPGRIVICDGTSVMRGNEIVAPKNNLSPSAISSYIAAYNKVATYDTKISMKSSIYYDSIMFATYKLVPLNEIHGWYNRDILELTQKEL